MEHFNETLTNVSAQVQLNEANTLDQILFMLPRVSVDQLIEMVQTMRQGKGGKPFLYSLLSRLRNAA